MEPSKIFASSTSPSPTPDPVQPTTELPSSPKESSSTSEVVMVAQVPERSQSGLLQQFEGFLGEDKLQLFEKRYEEKFDLKTDELYNIWFQMKNEQPVTTEVTKTPEKKQIPEAESPFSKHLKVPSVSGKKTKPTKRVPMPKAITGEVLIEKKEKKEKEEAEKKKRQQERIDKQQKKKELAEKKKDRS